MGTVEELADLLDRLRADPEHTLRGFSNPRISQPPFRVRLAAWATGLAADLEARYGDLVVLQVGHLQYPGGTLRSVHTATVRPPLIDPLRAAVVAPEHFEVRSGYDLRSTVSIQNLGAHPLVIRTNGVIQSVIVDPATGEVIGSFADAQGAAARALSSRPWAGDFRTRSHRISIASTGARLFGAAGSLGARGHP